MSFLNSVLLFVIIVCNTSDYQDYYITIVSYNGTGSISYSDTKIITEYLTNTNNNHVMIFPSVYNKDMYANMCEMLPSLRHLNIVLFVDQLESLLEDCDHLAFEITAGSMKIDATNSFSIVNINFRDTYLIHDQSRHLLAETSEGTSLLPRSDGSIAVGVYNKTIFLFGGDSYGKQFVQFDLISQNITDHGERNLSFNAYGNSQYYTQINDSLYWIDPNAQHNRINIYNLQTNQLTQHPEKMLTNVGVDGCLASHNQLLFVVGGYFHAQTILNKCQIFNISSRQWIYGPDMSTARKQHSCIVDPKTTTLYAIGGTANVNQVGTVTIETVLIDNIMNISNQKWAYSINLIYAVLSSRAVLYADKILVIGGFYAGDPQNYIQTIPRAGGAASYYGALDDKIYSTAAIQIDHTLYTFGGYNGKTVPYDSVNSWQYRQLPTIAPTNDPTNSPTDAPTNAPSIAPTNDPTNSPTDAPTIAPSITPTNAPTIIPTNAPTNIPSNVPTNVPTLMPTISTMSPITAQPTAVTISPTIVPSDSPTSSPTMHPTRSPVVKLIIIGRNPTSSPETQNVNGISTSIAATEADKNTSDGNDSGATAAIIVTSLIVFILFVLIIIVYYQRSRHLKQKQLDDCYVELIGAGEEEYHILTPTGPVTKDINTGRDTVGLNTIENCNDDASSVMGNKGSIDEDGVYEYAAPTDHDKTDEGDIVTPGMNKMITPGSFEQIVEILNDNVEVQVTDDQVVNDNDTEQ